MQTSDACDISPVRIAAAFAGCVPRSRKYSVSPETMPSRKICALLRTSRHSTNASRRLDESRSVADIRIINPTIARSSKSNGMFLIFKSKIKKFVSAAIGRYERTVCAGAERSSCQTRSCLVSPRLCGGLIRAFHTKRAQSSTCLRARTIALPAGPWHGFPSSAIRFYFINLGRSNRDYGRLDGIAPRDRMG
jgi:hypothetical protein